MPIEFSGHSIIPFDADGIYPITGDDPMLADWKDEWHDNIKAQLAKLKIRWHHIEVLRCGSNKEAWLKNPVCIRIEVEKDHPKATEAEANINAEFIKLLKDSTGGEKSKWHLYDADKENDVKFAATAKIHKAKIDARDFIPGPITPSAAESSPSSGERMFGIPADDPVRPHVLDQCWRRPVEIQLTSLGIECISLGALRYGSNHGGSLNNPVCIWVTAREAPASVSIVEDKITTRVVKILNDASGGKESKWHAYDAGSEKDVKYAIKTKIGWGNVVSG